MVDVWSHGVMVSTLDSESSNLSSNLSGTFQSFFSSFTKLFECSDVDRTPINLLQEFQIGKEKERSGCHLSRVLEVGSFRANSP